MHGPDGEDYRNENFFREIEPENEIVIEHVLNPHFLLTVTLTARGDETQLVWAQEFESPEVAAQVRARCGTANEQVLNRLESVLVGADAVA